MFLTIVFLGVFIIGILRCKWEVKNNRIYSETGNAIKLVGLVLLVTNLLCWIAVYSDYLSGIQKFNATRITVANSRSYNVLERIQIQDEVLEANRWVVKMQYWNSNWFCDSYTPDAVDTLTLID